jgi:transposase
MPVMGEDAEGGAMAMTRISMRKIREVLRLRWELGMKQDDIAASCGVARSTVGDYLRRGELAKLTWPLAPALVDDAALEALLYPKIVQAGRAVPQPDWAYIHRELGRKGVTLQLLWQEYKEANTSGYQYSQFAALYATWRRGVELVFRNQHAPGERLFVDYAGQTVKIYDATGGATREAQIFVATWGASNYTYAEATWTQTKMDFIGAHVRAFAFFGVAPFILVPDNLKSGVDRPCRYDPDINQAYYAMAGYYGSAVIPARSRRPRDKAKVENGVLVVERWILAALRHRKFFSLDELNGEIRRLLRLLNDRRFRKMDGTRASVFAEIDRPSARPLPELPYEVREIKLARVHIDYHVELLRHFYSVPYQFVQKQVELHYTPGLVEIFHRGQRIASHARRHKAGAYSTVTEHMPESHRQYAKWTPERLINWAKDEAGPAAAKVASAIMLSKPHPQIGFKAVLGLMNLGRHYGSEKLEKACERALAIQSPSYQTVKSTLRCGLEARPLPTAPVDDSVLPDHENIRGAAYYQ